MRGRPVGTTKLRPEFRRAFIALYRDPLFTVAALQERFGLSEATVYVTARRLKLPSRAAIKRARGLPSHGPLPDEVSMPRGQSTRITQLSLFTVRPYPQAAITRQNRERGVRSAAKQLARLEVALATQRLAETPRWRRCEACGGREDTTAPHEHGRAA